MGIYMNNLSMKFLSQIRVFASLPEKEIWRVAQSAVLRSFAKNEILFTQGRSKMDGIYILQSGEIELYYEREDHKTQVSRLSKGDIFGGISVLMNSGVCLRTAKVARESTCYMIPVDVFMNLCRDYRHFHKHFVDAFGQRMVDESYASIFASTRAFHFLSSIAPFSFLPEAEIEKAAMELSLVFHPKNTLIFTQGLSKIESLYIIQNGAAERYFEEGDNNIDTTLMSEGDLFGGISMLINNSISIRSLRTTEDTHFYVWPKTLFSGCLQPERAVFGVFYGYIRQTHARPVLCLHCGQDDSTRRGGAPVSQSAGQQHHPEETDFLRFRNDHSVGGGIDEPA